jgi:hypothetical protein
MPVNLSPRSSGDHGHAAENPQQHRKLQNEQNIVIAVGEDSVLQYVFVGVHQEHVNENPPQQKNQKIQGTQVEFLLALLRARPHHGRGHHRNRLEKQWNVRPKWLGR